MERDTEVIPANKVIDYKKKVIDVEEGLGFVKMQCQSVDEAKRRALVLALLTYDLKKSIFVKVATSKMLEDPFVLKNISDLK